VSWRALTEDDIRAAMAGPEDTAYRETLLATGQSDPLPEIMSQVTAQVRNAIRSCAKNQLHADASYLPEGAIFHAVSLVRYRLLSRFAIGEQEQPGDARTNEYREALRWLELVRSCREVVEQPGGTGSETGPGGGTLEQITPSRRRADREGLRGL
jgi:hypothetical protein